jgi:hypothetical protein
VLVQAHTRGWSARRKLAAAARLRVRAARIVQQLIRGGLGRAAARTSKLQQLAEWEQLWSVEQQSFYYYHKPTGNNSTLQFY